MKVIFQQSGGFAGLTRGCELDTESLDPSEAATLENLVQESAVSAAKRAGAPNAADLSQYEITIETGHSTRRIALDDLSVTPELAPLLEFLMERARPQPPA